MELILICGEKGGQRVHINGWTQTSKPTQEKEEITVRFQKKALLLILVILMACIVLTACSSGTSTQQNAALPKDISDTSGIYTHELTGEDMRDRLVASWSAVTHLDTLHQYNTLMLTESSGNKYELVKDLYNGEMSIHIEARFYGNYTHDGANVTLGIPTAYTWIYYRNGRVMNPAAVINQPVDLESKANDGCSFFGDYLDYHGYHRVEEMNVVIDPATGHFTFDIAENDDAAALGAESEDDGFNAGPIFVPVDDEEAAPADDAQ